MHTSTSLVLLISGLLSSSTSATNSAIPTRALFSSFKDAPQQAFLPALLPLRPTDEPWLATEDIGERNVTLWDRLEGRIEEARAQARASPCSTSSVISVALAAATDRAPQSSSPSTSPCSSPSSPSPPPPPPSPSPILQERQTITTTLTSTPTSTTTSLPNGGCPTTYSACTDGNLGWCCPRTAACSRDYLGNVGCCNYGAVCTGTIGAQSTQSTQTQTTQTTTAAGGSGGNGGGAAGATTTGGAGFIMVSGTNVATLGVGGSTSGAESMRHGIGGGWVWGMGMGMVLIVGVGAAFVV